MLRRVALVRTDVSEELKSYKNDFFGEGRKKFIAHDPEY
jgi:hypothetical protein